MPRDEIQRLFSPSIKAIYEQVVRPIKRLKPSEFEYLTMMGLIIWKCESMFFEQGNCNNIFIIFKC